MRTNIYRDSVWICVKAPDWEPDDDPDEVAVKQSGDNGWAAQPWSQPSFLCLSLLKSPAHLGCHAPPEFTDGCKLSADLSNTGLEHTAVCQVCWRAKTTYALFVAGLV